MLKGTISLLLIATVVWVFWMTKEWMRNPENRTTKRKK
jgi:hypothetical protein